MRLAKKYLSAIIILVISLCFLTYGIVKAPITDNSAAIYQKYDCFRGTADARATDIYCYNPKLDSIYSSTKHYLDKWTKLSGVFLLLGLVDLTYLSGLNRKL